MVAMKFLQPSLQLARQHYVEHVGKPFFDDVTSYLCSGPVVAMVWEGHNIIKASRQLVGSTDPSVAYPGTIRGDWAMSIERNLVHGSDSEASAAREIALWFSPEELYDWQPISEQWMY